MDLRDIYVPVEEELKQIDGIIKETLLDDSGSKGIFDVNRYLLESSGKKLRPAVLMLSAGACAVPESEKQKAIKIAAAFELIHMASLVHDDVIDSAHLRHSRPTINKKWAESISVALGDYINAIAFDIISSCGDEKVLGTISTSERSMCEGELLQVLRREDFDIEADDYLSIIKKKTAGLFAAAAKCGAIIAGASDDTAGELFDFGMNFGVAFQIIDDYMDLVADEEEIRKIPGQDIKAGETTMPLLNLWESVDASDKERLKQLLSERRDKQGLEDIKKMFFACGASEKTKESVLSFVNKAKNDLNRLRSSEYKKSLLNLLDFIFNRGFGAI